MGSTTINSRKIKNSAKNMDFFEFVSYYSKIGHSADKLKASQSYSKGKFNTLQNNKFFRIIT